MIYHCLKDVDISLNQIDLVLQEDDQIYCIKCDFVEDRPIEKVDKKAKKMAEPPRPAQSRGTREERT